MCFLEGSGQLSKGTGTTNFEIFCINFGAIKMREQSNSNTSTALIVAQTQHLFFNLKESANLFCLSNSRVPALSSEVPFQLGRSCKLMAVCCLQQ